DRAALLHLIAGQLLKKAGQQEAALAYYKEGQEYKPKDQSIRQMLAQLTGNLVGHIVGTGFVVAADGVILTNYHVIEGPGKVMVRLPEVKDPVPAQIVAQDPKRDMALLRIEVPKDQQMVPLTPTGQRPLKRGEQVAAWGYPLTDQLGAAVKFTKGEVSAPPEEDIDNHILLDIRVNPGNSGGPLCDAFGNLAGTVTAKTSAGTFVDSYGIALPAKDLTVFLQKNLKGYRAGNANKKKMAWDEVSQLVEPSVLPILKTP